MASTTQTGPPRRLSPAVDDPEVQWLARMGVVAIDADGAWSLTELGKGAMARFHSSCRGVGRSDTGPAALVKGSLL